MSNPIQFAPRISAKRTMARALLVATAALAVTACDPRETPTKPKEQLWDERHRQLMNLNEWDMRGRIGRGGWFSFTASLSWKHQPTGYNIRILGPFGNPNVTIAGNDKQMTLRSPEGVLKSTNPEADFKRQLGWSLPMQALPYWVRGIPAPGAHEIIELDEFGQIAEMKQRGWVIKFSDYETQPLANGLFLPTDMHAERETDGPDEEEVTIAVSVRRWFKPVMPQPKPAAQP